MKVGRFRPRCRSPVVMNRWRGRKWCTAGPALVCQRGILARSRPSPRFQVKSTRIARNHPVVIRGRQLQTFMGTKRTLLPRIALHASVNRHDVNILNPTTATRNSAYSCPRRARPRSGGQKHAVTCAPGGHTLRPGGSRTCDIGICNWAVSGLLELSRFLLCDNRFGYKSGRSRTRPLPPNRGHCR